MSNKNDAGTSTSTIGNDQEKDKSPPSSDGNQENVGNKSGVDVSESVKALVKATVAEELAKFNAAGSKPGTQPPSPSEPLRSKGEQLRSKGEQHGLALSLPGLVPFGMTEDNQPPM